jgi:hypothetical protein
VPFAGSSRVGSVLMMALWMISWAYIVNVLMALYSCPQGRTGPEDEASPEFFARTALKYLVVDRSVGQSVKVSLPGKGTYLMDQHLYRESIA